MSEGNDARDYALGVVALLDELSASDDDSAVHEWLGGVLDIEIVSAYSMQAREWSVRAVEALVTFGGPSCRVIADNELAETVTVEVVWGSDSVSLSRYLPAVSAALWACADMAVSA